MIEQAHGMTITNATTTTITVIMTITCTLLVIISNVAESWYLRCLIPRVHAKLYAVDDASTRTLDASPRLLAAAVWVTAVAEDATDSSAPTSPERQMKLAISRTAQV